MTYAWASGPPAVHDVVLTPSASTPAVSSAVPRRTAVSRTVGPQSPPPYRDAACVVSVGQPWESGFDGSAVIAMSAQ